MILFYSKYLGHQHDHLAYAHTYIDSKTGRPGVTPNYPPPKTSDTSGSYAFASRKGLAAVHLGNLAVSKPAVAPKDMEKILLRAFVEAAVFFDGTSGFLSMGRANMAT